MDKNIINQSGQGPKYSSNNKKGGFVSKKSELIKNNVGNSKPKQFIIRKNDSM